MQTILRILKQAGGWHHGLYLKIENPPYMAFGDRGDRRIRPVRSPLNLCRALRRTERRPHARPGDVFRAWIREGPHLSAFYYRNDYAGRRAVEPAPVRDQLRLLVSLHQQHERFAKVWDNNLRLQGFAEAFEQQQQTPRA